MIGRSIVRMLCEAKAEVTSVSLDDVVADDRAKSLTADLTELSVCMDMTKGME